MKKLISAMLIVMMLLSGSAMAESLFGGVALIDDDAIYYSGSVDGETLGVYQIEPDGSAWQLYHTDAILLAESDSGILLMDHIETQAILLGKDGNIRARVDGYYGIAIEEDGWFYLGNLAISDDGTQTKELFEAHGDELYFIEPIFVEDGYLYYIDSREFGPYTFGEASSSTGSLCRIAIAGGEAELICGPGVTVIGCEDDRIIFEQRNFWYDGTDATYEVQVDEGLYICNADGSNVTKLSSLDSGSENSYLHYGFIDDNVIYGTKNIYDEATDEVTTLVCRITTQGEILPDVSVPQAALCAVDDGMLILVEYDYYEADNGDFVQTDNIIVYNPENGTNFVLNEGREDTLFYTEADPDIIFDDGMVYWVSYNSELEALEFYCGQILSGEVRMLAPGYSWANMEAVG